MADRENMSVEEMLAACRQADGGGAAPASGASEKPAEEESSPAPAASSEPKKAAAKPTGAAKGSMSVADMLAAARASDGGGTAAKEESASAPEKADATPEPQAAKKSPRSMSVAEMLAAARAEGSGGGAAEKEKPAAKAKPKAGKAAAKPAEPAAKKAPSGPKDTQSILAAARKADKSGPISKSEAAQRARERKAAGEAAKQKPGAPPMPERPAYARPTPQRPRDDEESRRGFFSLFLGSYLAVGFTSLGLVNLLWTLGFARFMFPNILTEPPTRFKVGPPANFAPGQVETKFKAQFGVWIVNALYNGVQIIFALKTVCTHLGCTPNWLEAEQKFKCPCHGSGFYKDGINFEGPAPRPLERYAIRVADDGQLEVDKSKTFQEEKGQWTDGASYEAV